MTQLARTPKQVGEALRRYRRQAELSQAQLASLAGMRQATVSQIEGGQSASRIETICDLLAALGLEMTIAPRSTSSAADIEDIF